MKLFETIQADRKFAMVDICKFIMAFVVIAIHTNPVVNCTNSIIVQGVIIIEGWAVPFFFIASGFFLFYNMEKPYSLHLQRMDSYLKKIIILYCAWTLISFPLTVYGYVQSGNSMIECVLSYIKYFFFVGKLYNSYHLWYLLALIFAVIVIRFMLKRNIKVRYIVLTAIFFYTMSEFMLYIPEYVQDKTAIIYKLVSLYQYVFNKGGIYTGMIYVVIGMLIAQSRKYINRWLAILVMIGINLLKIYCYEIVEDYLNIIESALFFMIVVGVEIFNKTIYRYLRKASTIIYLSHLIWYSFYSFIIIREPNKLGLDSFVATSLLSLVNAGLLIVMMRSEKFKWIKKIT